MDGKKKAKKIEKDEVFSVEPTEPWPSPPPKKKNKEKE